MEQFDDTSGTDAPSEESEELSADDPSEATQWAAEAETEGEDDDLESVLDDEDDDDDDEADLSEDAAV